MLLVAVVTVLILILILPTIKELIHRYMVLGVHVRVSKYDVNDGISLAFP